MGSVTDMVNEILEGKGYVLIPDLLSQEDAAKARSLVLELAQEEKRRKAEEGKELEKLNINKHVNTERLIGLIFEGEIFEQIVQHPRVIEIIEAILGYDMILSSFSAHILNPEARNMGVHVDYPYWAMKEPFPDSHAVMGMQVIWMVEDFNENNGAPVFAPCSQKRCKQPKEDDKAEFYKTMTIEKLTGKAGSVVISHGLCWHDTSINNTDKPRVSILSNYIPKVIRPLRDPLFNQKQDVLDPANPKLQQLFGFQWKEAINRDTRRMWP